MPASINSSKKWMFSLLRVKIVFRAFYAFDSDSWSKCSKKEESTVNLGIHMCYRIYMIYTMSKRPVWMRVKQIKSEAIYVTIHWMEEKNSKYSKQQ